MYKKSALLGDPRKYLVGVMSAFASKFVRQMSQETSRSNTRMGILRKERWNWVQLSRTNRLRVTPKDCWEVFGPTWHIRWRRGGSGGRRVKHWRGGESERRNCWRIQRGEWKMIFIAKRIRRFWRAFWTLKVSSTALQRIWRSKIASDRTIERVLK